MSRRLRGTVGIALMLAPLALLAAACSRPPEQQFLTQFFRASRARDNATLAMMSAVDLDPREHGEVTGFDITSISDERRTPLDFKTLIDAQAKAAADESDLRQRRVEFESANRPALEVIAKLEREPTAKFNPAQQQLKAEWDRYKQDAMAVQKATSSARNAFNDATGPAEASLTQPGQPAFAADKFQGELVSKDVTVEAEIRKDGETSTKTLVVTIQRVEGTQDGAERRGRPIITRIQGL